MQFVFATMLFISCFSASAQNHFELTGEVEGLISGTKVYIRFADDREDSVVATDNFFRYKGTLDAPCRVYVMTRKPKLSYTSFWVENTSIRLKGHIDSLRKAKVAGSGIHDEYLAFSHALNGYETVLDSLSGKMADAKKSGDSLQVKQLKGKAIEVQKNQVAFQKEYIRTHPASFISLENLFFLKSRLRKSEVEALYAGLTPALRNSHTGKQVSSYLALFAEPQLGEPAPDFVQHDPEGRPVKLEQFRGKYVLLDFWGTWCAPCIQEIPNLVKLYTMYKDRGFEIVAVAADQNKATWLKAIKDYKMDWVNLSELKGDQDKVILTYGINYFPANYLIDPNGVIVARDLHGEKLELKLKEIFK